MAKESTTLRNNASIWLMGVMLLVGASAPFLMSWATPFELWARHQINSFPPSMWIYILMIALYPIGVVDFFNRFLRGKLRREAWYALAFTVPLLVLLVGTGLSPLPDQGKEWSMGANMRYLCLCGAMGTVIGIGAFLLVSVFGSLLAWLWRVIRRKPKVDRASAPLTLKSLVFWMAIVAINLAIFLGDSNLVTQTRTGSFLLDQAAITLGVCLVVAFVCFFVGRWLRRSGHFVSASFVLLTLPILLTMGFMLFSPWPIWGIQEGLFHFMFLWVIYSVIMAMWNYCVRLTEPLLQQESNDGLLQKFVGRPLFWASSAAWLFAGGWIIWHLFAPNPSPKPEDIRSSIAKRLDPNAGEDWVDVWNRQNGLGLAPEKNGVVDLLRINFEALAANRMLDNWQDSLQQYFELLGLKPDEYSDWLRQIENSRLTQRELRVHRYLRSSNEFRNWWHALPEEPRDLLRDQTLDRLRNVTDQGRLASWSSRVEHGQILRDDDELETDLFSDEGYPPGAKFLESVSEDLKVIRGLANKEFFWPLVRIAPDKNTDFAHYNHEVDSLAFMILQRPMSLLRMAAANDAGSNRMDAAIENCLAITNLCRSECAFGTIDTTTNSLQQTAEMHIDAAQTIYLVGLSPHANDVHRKKLMELLETLRTSDCFVNDRQMNFQLNLMFDQYVTRFHDPNHPDRLTTMALFRPWSHMIRLMPRTINWSDFHDMTFANISKEAEVIREWYFDPDSNPSGSTHVRILLNPASAWLVGGIDAKTKELASRYSFWNEREMLRAKQSIAGAQFGIAIENYRQANGAYPKNLADVEQEIFASMPGPPNPLVWDDLSFEETDDSFNLELLRHWLEFKGPTSNWIDWPN